MISPHAQALYDRLIMKKGIDGNAALPGVQVPGRVQGKDEHEHEGAGGGDLAPEKEGEMDKEVLFDERTSDEPGSLHGLDQGQHQFHPGDQGVESKASAGVAKKAGKSSLHATSKDSHDSVSEGHPGGSFGKEHQSTHVADALANLHYQSHPGTMGQKVNAKVMAHLKK